MAISSVQVNLAVHHISYENDICYVATIYATSFLIMIVLLQYHLLIFLIINLLYLKDTGIELLCHQAFVPHFQQLPIFSFDAFPKDNYLKLCGIY